MKQSKSFFNELFWKAESSLFTRLNADKPQWAMWLDITDYDTEISAEFKLRAISKENDWDTLIQLRKNVEEAFGITSEEDIVDMINNIKSILRKFKAYWFLAYFKEKLVGEIGLVTFVSKWGKYGRLLDVDILPEFQGQGLGNQLLNSIIDIAQGQGMKGLCLKADADDWKKDWYGRIGFQRVGVWEPE